MQHTLKTEALRVKLERDLAQARKERELGTAAEDAARGLGNAGALVLPGTGSAVMAPDDEDGPPMTTWNAGSRGRGESTADKDRTPEVDQGPAYDALCAAVAGTSVTLECVACVHKLSRSKSKSTRGVKPRIADKQCPNQLCPHHCGKLALVPKADGGGGHPIPEGVDEAVWNHTRRILPPVAGQSERDRCWQECPVKTHKLAKFKPDATAETPQPPRARN